MIKKILIILGGKNLKKAGAIISLVSSIIAVLIGFITLFFGGLGTALETEGASTVTNLGWGGVFLSFILIVISAAAISAKSKKLPVAIIVLSIITAIFGGTFVAIFMVLCLLGGILNFVGIRGELKESENELPMKENS